MKGGVKEGVKEGVKGGGKGGWGVCVTKQTVRFENEDKVSFK